MHIDVDKVSEITVHCSSSARLASCGWRFMHPRSHCVWISGWSGNQQKGRHRDTRTQCSGGARSSNLAEQLTHRVANFQLSTPFLDTSWWFNSTTFFPDTVYFLLLL